MEASRFVMFAISAIRVCDFAQFAFVWGHSMRSCTDKNLRGLPHVGFCMSLFFQFCDFARRVIKVTCSLDEFSHTVLGVMWQCLACSAPEFSFAFKRGVKHILKHIFHANRFSKAKELNQQFPSSSGCVCVCVTHMLRVPFEI